MLELVIALCLVALNGVFALSELAIVSARRPRLKAMAEQGRHGANTALALMEDSGRFLSTVQIGITLVSILAGAFSGAALGGRLTEHPVGASIESGPQGRTEVPGVWVAGNAGDLSAMVGMSAAEGVMAGAAINLDLVAEDARAAVAKMAA